MAHDAVVPFDGFYKRSMRVHPGLVQSHRSNKSAIIVQGSHALTNKYIMRSIGNSTL